MSDYLSHLVGRQLSPESGVRPRVASMFAPSEHVPDEGAALTEGLEEREVPGTATRRAARMDPWNTVARALASPPRPGRAQVPSMAAGLGREALEPHAQPASVGARTPGVEVPPARRSAPASPVMAPDPLWPDAARGEETASPVHGLDAEAPREGRSTARPPPEGLSVRASLPESEGPATREPLARDTAPRGPGRTPRGDEQGTSPLHPGMADRLVPSSAREASSRFSERHEAGTFETASRTSPLDADFAAPPARGAAPSPEPVRAPVGVPVRTSAAAASSDAPSTAQRAPAFPVQAERVMSAPLPSAPESAPAPVVQVTIGRIEVRAATPPAPARQAPSRTSPSPSLSLDEYLRRRNGGGR